ncbi:hypothetical protein HK096_009708, partial [Nowakowskiella sp. JEL0078]
MFASFVLRRVGGATADKTICSDQSSSSVTCATVNLSGSSCFSSTCSFTLDRATTPATDYFVEISPQECSVNLVTILFCSSLTKFTTDNFSIASVGVVGTTATATTALASTVTNPLATTVIPTTTTATTRITTIQTSNKISTISSSSSSISPSTTASLSTLSNAADSGPSLGVIFGITLAVLVTSAFAGMFVFWRRRVNRKQKPFDPSSLDSNDSQNIGMGPVPRSKVPTWKPVDDKIDKSLPAHPKTVRSTMQHQSQFPQSDFPSYVPFGNPIAPMTVTAVPNASNNFIEIDDNYYQQPMTQPQMQYPVGSVYPQQQQQQYYYQNAQVGAPQEQSEEVYYYAQKSP